MDGTGPQGNGPKTGRGLGRCAGNTTQNSRRTPMSMRNMFGRRTLGLRRRVM